MKRTLAIVSLFILFLGNITNAQYLSEKLNGYIPMTICYASDSTERISIPPPKEFLLKSGSEKTAEINVTYSLFPPEAIAAFEYAIGIWETLIKSDVPINVQANWRTQTGNTLGSAAPTDFVTNFKNIPEKGRYYPLALAEKLAGQPINPESSADIVCTFNKDINWYFGTDQDTPGALYDFVTVVLHEIGHGLGFTGFFDVRNNMGLYEYAFNSNDGLAAAFDLLVIDDQIQYLVDTAIFKVPSRNLYNALTSEKLYARSPSAAFVNRGFNPRLYVPPTWDPGSSVNHLNDSSFPPSSGNSLMTHAIGRGESVHDPGPVTIGILEDIGWNILTIDLTEPKDIEQVLPIVFNMTIDSENELDSTSLFVYYTSQESFNSFNTIPFIFDSSKRSFTASFLPKENVSQYNYYVSVKDIKGRVYTIPSNAPNEYNTVKIGADTEYPVIVHMPVPYFISTENEIPVSAYVDDNLGVDSVMIEFLINDIPQPSFHLYTDSVTLYKALFPVNITELSDGDIISYRIVATDSSQNKNIGISPEQGFHAFEVFDPVYEYYNDFNQSTTDFTLTDFDIYQAPNFNDGALNSPHPYLNSNQYNINFNFSTMLIHPIILKEDALMSFDEVVLVEPGSNNTVYGDDNFWDYVVVEGSKDNGKTWLPIIDGYDSRENDTWLTNYNLDFISDGNNETSTAIGTSEWYVKRQFNMLESGNFSAGDTILVRFRLFSDQLANGWGWCIDNLSIQYPLAASTTSLSPGNVLVYPNPFNEAVNVSITINKPVDIVEIELYNLYGQKIYSQQIINAYSDVSENINLNDQPAGLYLLNIKENGIKVLSKKVVKQ